MDYQEESHPIQQQFASYKQAEARRGAYGSRVGAVLAWWRLLVCKEVFVCWSLVGTDLLLLVE
jgi:hypothetical protein